MRLQAMQDDFRLYDAKTKKPVSIPAFSKINYIFLDHDKTMTYKQSIDNPMLSKFLHPFSAKALERCLEVGMGISICSTSHITRLLRQYRIINSKIRSNLPIIGEEGSVFAIPCDNNIYDIYIKEAPRELIRVKNILKKVVDEYRETTNFDVFLNRDLLNHITLENFERSSIIRDQLYDLAINVLKDNQLQEKFWVKKGTDSIEINISAFDKEFVADFFKDILVEDGDLLAIGDGESDVPLFKKCIGIQIPPTDMTIDEIKPLDHARFLAIGSEGGGMTTSQLLNHICANEKYNRINFEDLSNKIRKNLENINFIRSGQIDADDIEMDYTLPQDIAEKHQEKWLCYENALKDMYIK